MLFTALYAAENSSNIHPPVQVKNQYSFSDGQRTHWTLGEAFSSLVRKRTKQQVRRPG